MFQVSNVTFAQENCDQHSVEISIPSQEVSLHKECGISARKPTVLSVRSTDLSFGLIEVHLKMLRLDFGVFSLSWEYIS